MHSTVVRNALLGGILHAEALEPPLARLKSVPVETDAPLKDDASSSISPLALTVRDAQCR